MSARVALRLATPADLVLLQRWDGDPDVAASTGDDGEHDWETELPRTVPWRKFLIAEADGRPVGVLQIIDPAEEESHYWGEGMPPDLRAIDIWIGDAADRGRGLGTAIMHAALRHCFADPRVPAVLIDPLESNTGARRFYERLGFRAVGPRRFGTDDCMVYRFDRTDWR